MQVILASASPRRKDLLEQVNIKPLIFPADFAEVTCAENARQVVLKNAEGKCQSVVKQKGDSIPVIAADTIVVIDGEILGKPKSAAEAADMLQHLSGRKHKVMTGVAVAYEGKLISEVCITDVFFRELTFEEIIAYVTTGEPLDKAGAYGIQGQGAILVEKIEGCYNNVVGLPLTQLYLMLKKLGVKGIADKNY